MTTGVIGTTFTVGMRFSPAMAFSLVEPDSLVTDSLELLLDPVSISDLAPVLAQLLRTSKENRK